MANREDILREQTFKGDVEELDARVFYTLTAKKGLELHRVAKAISLLLANLHRQELLDDDDIDELLFNCIG